MSDWRPASLARRGTTKRQALTEAIIADVESGRLAPNFRMPTHRDLADELGISVQTVSFSYKEAERLGYLRGEVGRGTFVRDRITDRADRFMLDRAPGETVDLSIARCVYTDAHEKASRQVMGALSRGDNSAFMRPCRPIAGLDRHREAARAWLRQLTINASVDRILITNGTAHGLFLALASVVRPGDVVLTEALTDHGVIGLASVLGFTLRGLATDKQGILPDALEAACASGPVKALVMTPSLTNPTSHLASAKRRGMIADIARKYGVFVVEDEVMKPLLDIELPSMTTLIPELGFCATSFTKSVLTGLRVGYLVVPSQFSIRAGSVLRVTSWSATYLSAEIASRWIEDGTAELLLSIQRTEIGERQRIVREMLGAHIAGAHPLSLSAWLKVPEQWTEAGLVAALADRNIAVTPSDPFVAGSRGAGGIRICIGGRMSEATLRGALRTMREIFEQLPPVFDIRSIA
jgi:DNA-binding transcriptional MocR family regulator